jgi:hypothetical protein
MTAILVIGMISDLADFGYFIFMDIPDLVNILPGGLMTFVSAGAVALSFWVWSPSCSTSAVPTL